MRTSRPKTQTAQDHTPARVTSSAQSAPLALLALLIWTSCVSDPVREDYDHSCTKDADCAAVVLHRDCECGEPAAVNKRELERVKQDNEDAARRQWCPSGQLQCDLPAFEAECHWALCRVKR